MHDYDPCWDYEVVDLHVICDLTGKDHAEVLQAVALVRERLAPAMGMADFDVFYAEHLGGLAIAVFCDRTSSRPIIGLAPAIIKFACIQQDNVEGFAVQVRLSLAHELAHAYQERLGLNHEHPDGFNEDDSELFARTWVDSGRIELSILDRQPACLDSPGA